MTEPELKKRIIGKINSSRNADLLEDIYRLISSDEEDMAIYKLNEEQKGSVEEGIEQISRGEYLSGPESDADVERCLGE